MRKSFKNRNSGRNKIMLILVILLLISVAYATISTTLKITGSFTTKKQNWSVYWTNPVVTQGSVIDTPPVIDQEDGGQANTRATMNVALSYPGDFYEFTIDAVNNGTVDVAINNIDIVKPANLPDYVNIYMTYADGTDVEVGQILAKKNGNTPTIETYKVRVEYDEGMATVETLENLPDNGVNYSFSVSITYGLLDENSAAREEGMLYAIYTYANASGYPIDTYPYNYYIEIGDTLPLEFGSAGDTITDNYNGGPTSDYRKLRIEYDRYNTSHPGIYRSYTNLKFLACKEDYECSFDKRISYRPSLFYGYKIDENREVQNKYLCAVYNGNKYCFEYDSSEYRKESISESYDMLVKIYGEYDSDSETGCSNNDYYIDCVSSDERQRVYIYDDYIPTIRIKEKGSNDIYCTDYGRIYGPDDFYRCEEF